MTTKTKITGTTSSETADVRPSTRIARNAGSAAGAKQRATYIRVKSFALEREEKNFSKLFIIHEKENWWKMIGHSAILFHYEVSKWIGMKSKLQPDTDYDAKSEDGVVNIRDVYLLDSKLTGVKVNLLEATPDYRIYNIGKKYTLADIAALRKTTELEWAKINKIILPREIFPSLFVSLKELLRKMYFSTRQLETYARTALGEEMLRRVAALMREYSLLACRTGLSTTNFLDETENTMQWIAAQMAVVAELQLLPAERIYQLLRAIETVRRDVEKCRPKKI